MPARKPSRHEGQPGRSKPGSTPEQPEPERGPNPIEHLRALAATPRAQIDYALTLIASLQHDLLQAALDVLTRHAVLERYSALAADGIHRDPGCTLRATLLRALATLAYPADAPLVERAVLTYEFMPPFHAEVAADLRAAALDALATLDPILALCHAGRLLTDPHTSRMTGEPAVTAARLIAAQDHPLVLYAHLLVDTAGIPDVIGECLRHLTHLPLADLAPLVDRYLAVDDEITLLGLVDLLLTHDEAPAFDTRILTFLRTTPLLDVVRYIASAAVAHHRDDLLARIVALDLPTPTERDRAKAALLRQALSRH